MKKIIFGIVFSVFALALVVAPSLAASYTTFGDATVISGGNPNNAMQLKSVFVDWSNFTYGGVNYNVPTGATLGSMTALSTDYKITEGDCGGGAPRFVLNYDNNPNTNVVVYVGPLTNFSGCTLNSWVNTGNLIGVSDARYDTGQMGGTFYDTYSNAVSLTSGHNLTGISFVVDGSWILTGKTQTVLIDNTNINGTVYTYDPNTPTNKDQCKIDGWKSLENSSFQPFKNQGQCVSYVQANEHAGKR